MEYIKVFNKKYHRNNRKSLVLYPPSSFALRLLESNVGEQIKHVHFTYKPSRLFLFVVKQILPSVRIITFSPNVFEKLDQEFFRIAEIVGVSLKVANLKEDGKRNAGNKEYKHDNSKFMVS